MDILRRNITGKILLVALYGIPVAILLWQLYKGQINIHIISGILLVLILFGIIYLLYLSKADSGYYEEIKNRVSFLLFQANPAFVLAGVTAGILTVIYLFFASADKLPKQITYDVFNLYFTTTVAALSINALYKRTAPIVDIDYLLEHINKDLENCKKEDKLYFVFPALNIGYFRLTEKYGADRVTENIEDHIYTKYKTTLNSKIQKIEKNTIVILYPRTSYERMFKKYAGDGNEQQKVAEKTAEEAESFFNDVYNRNGRIFEIHPDEFPPYVIVIGAITYVIAAYGMPTYQKSEKDGVKTDGTVKNITIEGNFNHIQGLAKLVVYRREDKDLADFLTKRIDEVITDLTNNQSNYILESKKQQPNNNTE